MSVDLARMLTELSAHLDVPSEPDLARAVRARITAPPRRARPWHVRPLMWTRRSVALAAALVVIASSIAVASYFGVRGVRIRVVPTPTLGTGAGTFLDLGARTPYEQIRTRVSFPIRIPFALGAPDETYLDRDLLGGRVSLLYHPRPDLPEAGATKAGLLLIEFEGSFSRASMEKGVEQSQIHDVTVRGARGIWIEGTHTVGFLDSAGEFRLDTLRLSDSVLLWQVGSVTLRLESALPMADTIRIAETVR